MKAPVETQGLFVWIHLYKLNPYNLHMRSEKGSLSEIAMIQSVIRKTKGGFIHER